MIIGSEILYFGELTSTNSHAISLLDNERPGEGTIIRAGFQTAGRGQPGNAWESEPGKNLLISIIIYPVMIRPGDQFIISKSFSLGIHDFVSRYAAGCSIKWPNDIYVNSDKIAGMLIESSIAGPRISYTIAGIGLNLNQDEFKSDAKNPVSLKMITGKEYDLDECIKQLAIDLDKRYDQLRNGEYREIRNDYISVLYRYGTWSGFEDNKGTFEGRLISVQDDGKMILEDRKGKSRGYYFKEIEFIS